MQIENHKEEVPFAHYEELFKKLDPADAAQRLGSIKWDGKEFYVNLLGREFAIAHPAFSIRALDGGKLWLESNGTFMGFGTTASLVEWKDEGVNRDSYGQTVYPNGLGERVSFTADVENDLVMAYDLTEKTYYLYDRSDLLKDSSADYLKKIKCEGHQTPAMGIDDSQGRYTASIRGYAIADGYIYQLSGSTSIYISVFDLDGKLQYCYRLPDHPELEGRSPGSIAVVDGKVYVTIQSGDSTCYFANLWVYEAAAE